MDAQPANGYAAHLTALDGRCDRIEKRQDGHGERLGAVENAMAAAVVREGNVADDVAEVKATLRSVSKLLVGVVLTMLAELAVYVITQAGR